MMEVLEKPKYRGIGLLRGNLRKEIGSAVYQFIQEKAVRRQASSVEWFVEKCWVKVASIQVKWRYYGKMVRSGSSAVMGSCLNVLVE